MMHWLDMQRNSLENPYNVEDYTVFCHLLMMFLRYILRKMLGFFMLIRRYVLVDNGRILGYLVHMQRLLFCFEKKEFNLLHTRHI